MKRILPIIGALSMLLISASASAGKYYTCSTDGCSKFGSAWTWSSYAKTRYPIVLAHGMAGFDAIGPMEYFYGVPSALARKGATVYVTTVAGMNATPGVRGEQLLAQVKHIVAITGAEKVNLIAHSQGTLDSRYVAAVAPHLVASVTGVAGPNTGSPVADLITDARELVGEDISGFVASIVDGFIGFMDLLSGSEYEEDSLEGLGQLTTEKMAAFNAQFPAGMPSSSNPCGEGAAVANGIRYYSWSGTGHLTNGIDPSDYAFSLTGLAFGFDANDGLVGRCSSHLGDVIRDNYFMNHLDEVNLLLGLRSIFETNPVSVFRIHANRLKRAGL